MSRGPRYYVIRLTELVINLINIHLEREVQLFTLGNRRDIIIQFCWIDDFCFLVHLKLEQLKISQMLIFIKKIEASEIAFIN